MDIVACSLVQQQHPSPEQMRSCPPLLTTYYPHLPSCLLSLNYNIMWLLFVVWDGLSEKASPSISCLLQQHFAAFAHATLAHTCPLCCIVCASHVLAGLPCPHWTTGDNRRDRRRRRRTVLHAALPCMVPCHLCFAAAHTTHTHTSHHTPFTHTTTTTQHTSSPLACVYPCPHYLHTTHTYHHTHLPAPPTHPTTPHHTRQQLTHTHTHAFRVPSFPPSLPHTALHTPSHTPTTYTYLPHTPLYLCPPVLPTTDRRKALRGTFLHTRLALLMRLCLFSRWDLHGTIVHRYVLSNLPTGTGQDRNINISLVIFD